MIEYKIEFEKIDKKILKEIVSKFLNLALDIIKIDAQKEEQMKAFERDDIFKSIIASIKTGLIITSGSPETGNYGSTYRTIYGITNQGKYVILTKLSQSQDFQNEWDILNEWGLFPKTDTPFYEFELYPFGRIINNCLDQLFESIIEFEYLPTIESFIITDELITPIINKVIELEKKQQIEIGYYYFFYGSTLKGIDDVFDKERNQRIIYPTNAKREELSLKMDMNLDRKVFGSNKADYEFILKCSAWIYGKINISYNDLKLPNIYEKINLVPPEFFEEALYLLGCPQGKVKFLSQSTPQSKYSVSINLNNGLLSLNSSIYPSSSIPNWVSNTRTLRLSNRDLFNISTSEIKFIRKFGNFRIKNGSDPFISIIFNRIFRMINYHSQMDKILEACIVLETLLSNSNNEISFQLALKTSWLIGIDFKEREYFFEKMKKIYRVRSNIVHTGGESIKKSLKDVKVKKVDNFLFNIVRLIILRLLIERPNNFELLHKKVLHQKIHDLLLGDPLDILKNEYFSKALDEFIIKYIDQNV